MACMPLPCALLIDDHAMFRAGLRQVIKVAIPELDIFEAGSLDEALACPSSNVTVVLLDNKLNGLSGIEGIALIRRKWPLVPILMLSSQFEPEIVRLALARGVDGFLSKAESIEKIVQTLQQVMAGGATGASVVVPLAQKCLTPRQSAVLHLLHQGLTSKLIARQLFISENTARRHVQDILEFFKVASRAEAVFAARNQGLVG
jgi:DNA-binding NarL/FixJ family response regulator